MFTIKMKSFIIIWICLIILTLVINSVNAVTFQNEIYDKTSELSYDFDTEQSKDRYDINVLSKEIKKTPSTSSSSSLSYQEGAESCYTENHIKYKHGEKVIRSDPCEICLCMDGEIFCWWKKCNYRKLKNREIMNNKKQKNDKRKHRKRFDEQHKMNNNNNNNMKKLLKNFSQYYTLYSITRYDRDRDHATTDANNNNNKTKIVKKNLNANMNQQIKTDDDDDDDDMEFGSSKINKKNWKKITETTTSFEPLSSLKMYNLSEKKIFSNNDNDEDENDDRRTTNELKNNQKNYNNNNNISSEYHHSKVHNLNTKENKLLLKDENINKEEFITMIHSNFNMDDKETNHHHYHHHDNNNNKNNKKNNDNENEMKKISLNSNIQKDALINRREQQLVDVPMAKHYIITSSGNIENGEITAEDDIITDTEDYILPQYKNVLYNKDKYNYNSNDNNNNNNNKDHNKNENVSGNDNNNSNNNNNNENDNNNSINNKNNLLSNRKDNEGDEKSKMFSSDPSTLLLLSSSSSSLFSSPSQIIQRNKVTTTTDQTMNQNCIVMGNTYKIGTILPQETGNCLQCICIEGANEGEPPRVTCSPHNCPPLILPDLFDTTGY